MIYSEGKIYNHMNKITTEEVEKLAKLARIGFTEAEKQSLSLEMSAILEYIEKLDEVDVSQIEPTSQVSGLTNVTRGDEINRSDIDRDDLFSNTKEVENGFIKVKTVL